MSEQAAVLPAQRRGILSPTLDFLLLGGASLLLFPLAMLTLPPERVAEWHITGHAFPAIAGQGDAL